MRNRKTKKVIRIILSVFLIFALVNTAYWLYFTKVKFNKFEKAANGEMGKTYDKNPDFEVYAYAPTKFWGYRCELEVKESWFANEDTNASKNEVIYLIIFPKALGGYETKCTIEFKKSSKKTILFKLDENMKLLSGNEEDYNTYYDKIHEAYSVAHDMFGIYTL